MKSLEKGIDEKMFGWLYVLLDYSYPGEIGGNVNEIINILTKSYANSKKLKLGDSKEFLSDNVYYRKLKDYYNIALVVQKEREGLIN